MFDEDSQVNEQFERCERCERCDCGGIYCDEESGDWLCDNCTHNYGHAEEDASSSKHIALFKTEKGEEIEMSKAEGSLTFIRPLAYVGNFNFSSMSGLKPFETEQSVGFYNAIYGQDAIDSLKAEIVEATEMALGQAKKLIEKDKRIAELEARLSWSPELGPEEIKTLVDVALALGYSTPDSLEETCTGHGQRKLIMNIARGITGIIRRNEELGSRVTAHDLIEFCAIKQDEYRKKNNIIAAMEFCSIMAAIQEAVELREGEKG